MNTKSVQLTEYEITAIIKYHGEILASNGAVSESIERLKYLDKRLKDF